MDALKIVTTWGLWIWGIIIMVIVLRWCHDVNQKLDYILGRLEKLDKARDTKSVPENIKPEKPVSPLAAIGIIGGAILILFIIPIWYINK